MSARTKLSSVLCPCCRLHKGDWESSVPRWYQKFWMLVCTMVKHLSENSEKAMSGIKRQRDIAACIYKMGRARTKQEYECTLQDFQALHLEAAEWFHKRHRLFASYVFLEKGFRQFGVTSSNACESSNNAILCCQLKHYCSIVEYLCR